MHFQDFVIALIGSTKEICIEKSLVLYIQFQCPGILFHLRFFSIHKTELTFWKQSDKLFEATRIALQLIYQRAQFILSITTM